MSDSAPGDLMISASIDGRLLGVCASFGSRGSDCCEGGMMVG